MVWCPSDTHLPILPCMSISTIASVLHRREDQLRSSMAFEASPISGDCPKPLLSLAGNSRMSRYLALTAGELQSHFVTMKPRWWRAGRGRHWMDSAVARRGMPSGLISPKDAQRGIRQRRKRFRQHRAVSCNGDPRPTSDPLQSAGNFPPANGRECWRVTPPESPCSGRDW